MSTFSRPIVSADWLSANSNRVRIVDSRWSIPTGPMRAQYQEGHIPGAVFADVDRDLSRPAGSQGRHPLPTPEDFAATRSRLGMNLPVVVYDDRSGAVAARLWWMLDVLGAEAAVLEGGIAAWQGALVSGTETAPPADFDPVPWPEERLVDVNDVPNKIQQGTLLLDARSADRFAGRPNPIDARPGHIPGSKSRPWELNVNQQGYFYSTEELSASFLQHGLDGSMPWMASCGSGVTACHNLLAARLAGLADGQLYPGSWSEWSYDSGRPRETESEI
ncbi:MAG: sulfurtransferase [Planctomycetales bacterium]|nr:sulfurtransferase [Planctomycetales bacterium]